MSTSTRGYIIECALTTPCSVDHTPLTRPGGEGSDSGPALSLDLICSSAAAAAAPLFLLVPCPGRPSPPCRACRACRSVVVCLSPPPPFHTTAPSPGTLPCPSSSHSHCLQPRPPPSSCIPTPASQPPATASPAWKPGNAASKPCCAATILASTPSQLTTAPSQLPPPSSQRTTAPSQRPTPSSQLSSATASLLHRRTRTEQQPSGPREMGRKAIASEAWRGGVWRRGWGQGDGVRVQPIVSRTRSVAPAHTAARWCRSAASVCSCALALGCDCQPVYAAMSVRYRPPPCSRRMQCPAPSMYVCTAINGRSVLTTDSNSATTCHAALLLHIPRWPCSSPRNHRDGG